MSEYMVRALSPATWDGFAGLAQRHNGVFGGCWCTYFHTMHSEKTFDADDNRSLKQRLVEKGRAHVALIYNGDDRGRVVRVRGSRGAAEPDLGGRRWRRRGLPARHAGQEEVRALQRNAHLFERAGFTFARSKGMGNCVMRRTVP